MDRAYYSSSITSFLHATDHEILWSLASALPYPIEPTQRDAWIEQIAILRNALVNRSGYLYFEYGIPRMGKRIDVVLIIGAVVFVLEFKVGEKRFTSLALDQTCGYCLDLKNFHDESHNAYIAPVLIASKARQMNRPQVKTEPQNKKLFSPIKSSGDSLAGVIEEVLRYTRTEIDIDGEKWGQGRYRPTPTIIEAALELYNGHSVEEITRHEAEKTDINRTSNAIDEIIDRSKQNGVKSICFVTGVPGAGGNTRDSRSTRSTSS